MTNETAETSLRRVSRKGLAKVFGVTVADVDKWVGMNCPYIKRAAGKGDEWIFDTADVANWTLEKARRGHNVLR